jgi:hypothetical protein
MGAICSLRARVQEVARSADRRNAFWRIFKEGMFLFRTYGKLQVFVYGHETD